MARSVSVFYANFRLGTAVTFTRRLVDVTFNWTDNAGTPHTTTRTFTFPDDLTLIPAALRDQLLLDAMLTAERANQGVDN